MLYPNLLQLSFSLGLSYSSFALPPTLGAIIINSTLSVAPSGSLDTPSPVCIDNTQHPTWGLTLEQFDFRYCRHAMELIAKKLEGNIYTSYDFYSRQVFPSGPGRVGHEGWPLAQGAGAGNCALVVRMTRDFAGDALPISGGRFAPTSHAGSVQQNSWLFLLRSIETLLSVCVDGSGLPGWSMDTKNIVVAFWPRSSVINGKYGIRVVSAQADMNVSWPLLDSE